MYIHHRAASVALVLLGVFGLAVSAAEKPPEKYQNAMKDLGAFAQGIDKAVSDENYDAITKYAASAQAAFGVVEAFWTNKADSAAAKVVQTGGKLSADLAVVANLKSKEGAAYSAKAITDLCAGCHTTHRETMPDGTFQIK